MSGRVIDLATGKGIPNANIYIPARRVGCSTDKDGNFYLRSLIKVNDRLQISHIGYTTTTFKLKGQTEDLIIQLLR